jgi:hypothetical protein
MVREDSEVRAKATRAAMSISERGPALLRAKASDRKGSRLCENAQEPTRRRIVFSIALFPVAATALFLFRLTKLRRTFYAEIECLCFHTGAPGDRQGVGGASPLQ